MARRRRKTQRQMDYARYLKTPHWQTTRRRAHSLHGSKCNRCGSTTRLHVHHLTYERLGYEDIANDLEILCKPCHSKEHRRKRKR